MQNDDLDALAAEYVLGTLASDERAQAEALIGTEPSFAETVRQWERRLGELNVMVEAVEPPDQIWDKIKSTVGADMPADGAVKLPLAPGLPPMPSLPPEAASETQTEAPAEAKPDVETEHADPASGTSELLPQDQPASAEQDKSEATTPAAFTLLPPSPLAPARSAELVSLSRRVRRWRGMAVTCGAVAAALAALIVVSQVRPDLIPAGGFHVPQLVATGHAPPPAPAAAAGRFVAVLQQDPSGPAFLLTVDPARRTLTVRRVAAKTDAAHSFELWLIAPHAAKPLSLGLIGPAQYTERPLPGDINAAAVREATYAVSFEPAGGSKTGAPSGPVLFTGKLLESVPLAPAQKT